jgi:hypothetical protein
MNKILENIQKYKILIILGGIFIFFVYLGSFLKSEFSKTIKEKDLDFKKQEQEFHRNFLTLDSINQEIDKKTDSIIFIDSILKNKIRIKEIKITNIQKINETNKANIHNFTDTALARYISEYL